MKLYRFFLSILAGAALAAGCVQEQVISSLDSFQVENSYLSISPPWTASRWRIPI